AGLPVTFWTFLIGTLSISGFPIVTAGFWSKDEIIRAALSAAGSEYVLGILALITAGLTAFYMFRLFIMAFGWEWMAHDDRHLHEAPPVQTIPVIILAAGAVVAGYIPVASFLSPVFGQPVEVGTLAFWGLAGLTLEAREFRGIQTGRVRSYALVTLGGAVGVLGIVAYFLGYLPWKPAV